MATSCSVRSSGTDIAAHPAPGDLLDRRLDVIGIVVAAITINRSLMRPMMNSSPSDIDAQVAGPQPRASGVPGGGRPAVRRTCARSARLCASNPWRRCRHAPRSRRSSPRILDLGVGVDDSHRRRARRAIADQLGAAVGLVFAAFGMTGGQFLVVEADDRGRLRPARASRHTPSPRRVRTTAVGRSRQLNGANRSAKRRSVAACMRSLPLMMPSTSPRSSPAMSSSDVRRTASSKAKFGAAENDLRVAAPAIASTGRAAAGMPSGSSAPHAAPEDRCADSEYQPHVVVERQPRHDGGVRRGDPPESAK